MKHTHLLEQVDRDATAFSLRDFGTKSYKQCLNVLPCDVRAGWMSKDCLECLAVAAFHGRIVPRIGTGAGSEA